MDTSKEYAVCYAGGSGDATDTWRDSGIRLTLSKVNQITYGKPSRSFDSTTIGNDRLLPGGQGVVFTYSGILPPGSYFSLVNEVLESYNPCMTASTATGTADADHSGIFSATAAGAGINIGTMDSSSLTSQPLYALCYTEGTGTGSDPLWRDSYLRVKIQKIKSLSSAGVLVTTIGTLPYADKLEIIYEGSLAVTKWVSFVAQNLNGGNPCSDSSIAAAAKDSEHSGSFQAGTGVKILYPFTTSGLNAIQQYAVCYAEVSGDATDTWIDTGMRLRFFGWNNILQNRFVSGASSTLKFSLNEGIVAGDLIALLPEDGVTTCVDAPSADVTDGSKALRILDANAEITLSFLNPGYYFMCVCNMNGAGGTQCINANGGYAYIPLASIKIIDQPRLGNLTNPGDLRAISGAGFSYYIRGSFQTAFAVGEGDKIFFDNDCTSIPTANANYETLPMTLVGFSTQTKAAMFSLPSAAGTPLLSSGSSPLVLRACFATKEALAALGGPNARDYVMLMDLLTVSPVPRLGPLDDPSDIRTVSRSSATLRLHYFFPGDSFFFGQSCGSIPGFTDSSTGLLGALYDSSTSTAGFSLPSSPVLTSNGDTTKVLKCCFAPARANLDDAANWYELTDTLNVIPQPTAALTTTWKQNSVDLLDFSGPAGHAAQQGDTIVLQKDNCSNAHLLTATGTGLGVIHSAPMFLEAGGIASTFAIAQGKINEMSVGTYKMCFATMSSEVDTDSDFTALEKELTLTETVVVSPTLVVPDSVHLGVDIVVLWNATDGQYADVSQEGSWLGLYRKGECSVASEWQHKCYLVAYELPAGESGGVVRFSQQDYKNAGEYEIRYFRGNTRSGQGQVCAGLSGTGTGTYIQCAMSAAATSSTINVYGSIESQDDLASIPGLEHVVLV